MDSATHFVMGLGLAGLASLHPAVQDSTSLYTAIVLGTALGSQAPDLDGLLRMKSNATYIKNHRGASHSIPAIIIWSVLITSLLQLFYRGSLPFLFVGAWVLAAVVLHVFVDLFNAYGTQAMRPFSRKWISWNIIHIFDPVIFMAHVIAILAAATSVLPAQLAYPGLYLFLVLYYIGRVRQHQSLLQKLPSLDSAYLPGSQYLLIPTVSLFEWHVVKARPDSSFDIGIWNNKQLQWVDHATCSDHPAAKHSKNDASIKAFLYFTSYACAEVKEYEWGYEVRWVDVRYRHRKQYPFVAVLVMDKDYKTLSSYVGWLSDERLRKRLRMNTY